MGWYFKVLYSHIKNVPKKTALFKKSGPQIDETLNCNSFLSKTGTPIISMGID